MSEMPDRDAQPAVRRSSFLRSMKAVAWAFLGLRKRSEYQQDMESINPLHVIAAGILSFLLMVVALIALVHWVV